MPHLRLLFIIILNARITSTFKIYHPAFIYNIKTLQMKRKILVCVACISIVSVQAQDRPEHVAPAPPPPPIAMMAPAPPQPPVPPVPPEAPEETATIVNELGNEISVSMEKGRHMVIIKKDGNTRRIKLSSWIANRKYHEKKYGQLPPPPPPPPPVPAIEPI